jgi:vacuolar-type H+-ATPase subunit F/Vma7
VSEVAAIGEPTRVAGFALAGVRVYPAQGVQQTLAAWQGLPESVAVVILTAAAAAALDDERTASNAPLTVVMPV